MKLPYVFFLLSKVSNSLLVQVCVFGKFRQKVLQKPKIFYTF